MFYEALTWIELFAQLPLALYLVRKLSSNRPTEGASELAALMFACLNTMGSGVVSFVLWHMGSEVISEGAKMQLLLTEYGPYTVIRESL